MSESKIHFIEFLCKINQIEVLLSLAVIFLMMGIYRKKLRKYLIMEFVIYLAIFLFLIPVQKYGIDIFRLLYLKKKLVPESYVMYKGIVYNKDLRWKIEYSQMLYYKIKHAKEEYEGMEKALAETRGIEKKFFPVNYITNKV